MKRSEVVTKISKLLLRKYPFLKALKEEVRLEDADSILSLMEKAGMQPPFCDKIFQKESKVYIEANGNQWEEE